MLVRFVMHLLFRLILISSREAIDGDSQDALALGQIGVLRIHERAALVLHDCLALHKVLGLLQREFLQLGRAEAFCI